MKIGLACAAAVMALGLATEGASAKPVARTSFTYYTISGNSAVAIYNSMLRKGPRVDGAKAYAATSATTTQDGKLIQQSTCKIVDYRLKLDFVIKLPKIANEKVLPASDRGQWRSFQAFLKTHEETHRSIWLGCAADLERQVKKIRAKSCKDASRQASLQWDKARAACSKKHEAFDAAEQKKLLKHPFMSLVLRRSAETRGALASP
jgi:predicted secreted Zn-dependent protease